MYLVARGMSFEIIHKIKITHVPWREIWIFKVKNPLFLVKMGFEISMMWWVRNFVSSANLLHFHSLNHMNFFIFFWTLELVETGRNRFCSITFAPLKNDLPSSRSSACHGEQQQPQIKCANELSTYRQSFFQKRANRSHSPLMRYSSKYFFPHLAPILLHPSVSFVFLIFKRFFYICKLLLVFWRFHCLWAGKRFAYKSKQTWKHTYRIFWLCPFEAESKNQTNQRIGR
jgi:hypothetical protein